MMEGRGQSGDLQEMDCPYGFIALEAWFQTRIRPSGLGLNGFSTVAPWKERAWIDTHEDNDKRKLKHKYKSLTLVLSPSCADRNMRS